MTNSKNEGISSRHSPTGKASVNFDLIYKRKSFIS